MIFWRANNCQDGVKRLSLPLALLNKIGCQIFFFRQVFLYFILLNGQVFGDTVVEAQTIAAFLVKSIHVADKALALGKQLFCLGGIFLRFLDLGDILQFKFLSKYGVMSTIAS